MTDRETLAYRLLREIAGEQRLTQRALAKRLGSSLGAVNQGLRSLVLSGQVLVTQAPDPARGRLVAYALTPSGFARKASLARRLLARRLCEQRHILKDIAELRHELDER